MPKPRSHEQVTPVNLCKLNCPPKEIETTFTQFKCGEPKPFALNGAIRLTEREFIATLLHKKLCGGEQVVPMKKDFDPLAGRLTEWNAFHIILPHLYIPPEQLYI
jgi:hypothetical protein